MKTLLMVLLAVAVQPLFFIVVYFLIGCMIYFFQEVNHTVRGFKHSMKRSVWELEWKFKMLKGR